MSFCGDAGLQARPPVRFPLEQRPGNGDVVSRDRKKLSENALASPPFGGSHDWRDVAITTHRVGPAFNGHVGAMNARYGRFDVDVHKPATRQRAAIQSFLGGHSRQVDRAFAVLPTDD